MMAKFMLVVKGDEGLVGSDLKETKRIGGKVLLEEEPKE